MTTAMKARVVIFRAAEQAHMFRRAASTDAPSGEEWLCKCGKHYRGDGALEKGRRHVAKQVIRALDEAVA